jgi:hypothetical protein
MGEERKACKVLVGKPKGKKLLERPRCRWKHGIRMVLRDIGWVLKSGSFWLRIGVGGGLL